MECYFSSKICFNSTNHSLETDWKLTFPLYFEGLVITEDSSDPNDSL